MEIKRYNISFERATLFFEMVFLIISLAFLIRFLKSNSGNYEAWPMLPFALLSAAIVPTFLRKRNLSKIGFQIEQPKLILRRLFGICLIVFPALFCGILLLNHYKVALPLRPMIPQNKWFSWLIYQFIFVAVAEEAFFRGYVQTNIQCLITTAIHRNAAFMALTSVIISAAIFALFHSLLFGNIVSMITFFPGLILGWLFIKTKSLLAPILFHGLANVVYALFATAVT